MTNPFANLGRLDTSGVEEVKPKNYGEKKDPTTFNRGVYDDVEIYNITTVYPEMKSHSKLNDFAFTRNDNLDPTWVNLKLGIKQGTRKGFLNILLPTESLLYKTQYRDSDIEYRRLVDFFNAIGIKVSRSNVADHIKSLVNNVSFLEGVRLKITFGYKNAYVEYNKQFGDKPYVVMNAKDEVISKNADGTPLTFSSRDQAEAYGQQELKIKLQTWPEVKYINPASTPCKVDLSKTVSVKKVSKKLDLEPF